MTRLQILFRFIHLASSSMAVAAWANDWKVASATFGVLSLIDVWVERSRP